MKLSNQQIFCEMCMNLVAQRFYTLKQMEKISKSIQFQILDYACGYKLLVEDKRWITEKEFVKKYKLNETKESK